MSNDDITHTGQVYPDNVDDVHFKFTDTDSFVDSAGTLLPAQLAPMLELYLGNLSDGPVRPDGNPILTAQLAFNISQFFVVNDATRGDVAKIRDWDNFVTVALSINGAIDDDTALKLFVRSYRRMLHTDPGAVDPEDIDPDIDPASGGDWQILVDNGAITDFAQEMKNQFVAAFNHFVQNYPDRASLEIPPTVDQPSEELASFLQQFINFVMGAVTIESATTTPTPFATSFQELYERLVPGGGTTDEFGDYLVEFYEKTVAEKGFFIPTQEVEGWVEFVERKTGAFHLRETTLESLGSERLLILDRIFRLVADMIEILQKVAAVQADRLNMLTNFQKAYTEVLEEIHIFIGDSNDLDKISGGDADKADSRADLNQQNATYKEEITARRQLFSDDAKAMQSSINQSNDAVSQQANIATAILQQLSTILGAIFR